MGVGVLVCVKQMKLQSATLLPSSAIVPAHVSSYAAQNVQADAYVWMYVCGIFTNVFI